MEAPAQFFSQDIHIGCGQYGIMVARGVINIYPLRCHAMPGIFHGRITGGLVHAAKEMNPSFKGPGCGIIYPGIEIKPANLEDILEL